LWYDEAIEIDATHPIYPYHFATIGSIPNLCFEDDNEIMNLMVDFEIVISSYEFFCYLASIWDVFQF
jgi:hypothetical protein